MIPLNLSRVVNNPALQQNFQIERNQYESMNEGEWTLVAAETYQAKAVITPTQQKDALAFLPEGQREKNNITIYSPVEIRMGDGKAIESDVIIWNSKYYRVSFSKPWEMDGYWFVIATGFVHGA